MTWRRVLTRVTIRVLALSARLLLRLNPEWKARHWSNLELRRWAALFRGDVINVSGWADSDKSGSTYRTYFTGATSYTISNVGGARGSAGGAPEIRIDLTAEPDPAQVCGYDVVFNHTTLEHVFDIRHGVRTLCALSRDLVVVVVPFIQEVHWEEGSYGDYWRPTPFAMREMFAENGFELVHQAYNENPVTSVYLFCIATRQPEKWRGIFPAFEVSRDGAYPGRSWSRRRMPLE